MPKPSLLQSRRFVISGEAGLRSERCHRVARPPVDRLGSALFKPGRTWILGQRGWLGSALWGQRGWLGGALLGQRADLEAHFWASGLPWRRTFGTAGLAWRRTFGPGSTRGFAGFQHKRRLKAQVHGPWSWSLVHGTRGPSEARVFHQ